MKGFVPAKDVRRVFIAVDIGDEVRAALEVEQRRLRRRWPDVKWVAIGNVHLSLVFLGDVPSGGVGGISAAMDEAVRGLDPFECNVANLGCFGPANAPRVVWAGVTEGGERLVRLQRRIAEAVQALGFRLETRPFAPHVTLARVRSSRDAVGLADGLAQATGKPYGVVAVTEAVLMRSELRPAGPEYSVLHAARLDAQ